MYNNIKVIAFDADDTLWVNETYFRDAEHKFAKLLSKYETENKIDQELFKKENLQNLYSQFHHKQNVFLFYQKNFHWTLK